MLKDKKVRDKITGSQNIKDLDAAQFVKAGAGAGKTSSIKDRVLNLVSKAELSPERMVIITYTTKAANELMTRVRETLEANLELPNVEEALAKLTDGKISTFHSFCYDLLREYPIEFCIDPEASLADEQTTEIMLENCFALMESESEDDQLRKESTYAKEMESFLELLVETSVENLQKTFLAFYQNRDLKPIEVDTSELIEMSILEESISKGAKRYFHLALELYDGIIPGCEDDKMYVHMNEGLKYLLDSMSESEFVEHVLEGNDGLIVKKGAQKNYSNKEVLKELAEVVKEVKTAAAYMKNAQDILNYNAALKVYPYFESTVEEYKALYGFIDFFDCLYLVKKKLDSDAHLRSLIQKRFDVIIIDEFQDSDPMQSAIAFHLAGDDTNKLFFVGDPKQSIYGFSRADISIYLEVMDRMDAMKNGEVLELTTNFRSSGGLLDFINTNFSKILTRSEERRSVSVDYTPMDKCDKKKDGAFITSNWLVDVTSKKDKTKALIGVTRPREAYMVAANIQRMMKEQKLSAGDFLVLFKTGTAMELYEQALRQLDIPVVNTKSKNFLKRGDVIQLLNLLALSAFPKEKFYRHLVENSDLLYIDEEKLSSVLATDVSFEMKFRTLCNLSGFVEIAVESNEDTYLQFIENLCNMARAEYVANNYDLKRTFHNLFEKAVNDSFFSGIKLNDETVHLQTKKSNAVTLMTIHASKGLESKVVILSAHEAGAFKDSQYVKRETNEILAETPFLSAKKAEELGLAQLSDLYSLAGAKREEEDKRVLYVAVTRAEEQFICISKADGSNKEFLNILMEHSPEFVESESLSFDDYEADFSKLDNFNKLHLKDLKHNYDAKVLDEVISLTDVSVSVSKLIENPELFKNIEGRRDGKAFGTFTHLVMEYICLMIFNQKNVEIDTEKLIEKLYADYETTLLPEYLKELQFMAKGFLKSDLASDIIAAKAVHTEIPFLADSYHGIIDLVVESEDKVRVIDFKSDLLKSKKDEIMGHYKKQVDLYVQALGEQSGKEVVGECLYLFGGL
ncbi:hypothetical protein A9Q84_14665 [Halobacteriovorax marinus]|uniref:DNA 3'-5' helicase n=1 Tax=Halobacteriovorax marinus TaxID=97084 RepID=A0A1Y5F513_9BACT|nr:hypothetical protein A9Q84_14665 [Halobacteriovorax marinus]